MAQAVLWQSKPKLRHACKVEASLGPTSELLARTPNVIKVAEKGKDKASPL